MKEARIKKILDVFMLGCMCTGLCNFAKIAGFNSTCNFVNMLKKILFTHAIPDLKWNKYFWHSF